MPEQSKADLLEIVGALRPGRRFTGFLHRWNQQPNENRDDGDNNEKFHERETGNSVASARGPARMGSVHDILLGSRILRRYEKTCERKWLSISKARNEGGDRRCQSLHDECDINFRKCGKILVARENRRSSHGDKGYTSGRRQPSHSALSRQFFGFPSIFGDRFDQNSAIFWINFGHSAFDRVHPFVGIHSLSRRSRRCQVKFHPRFPVGWQRVNWSKYAIS